MKSHRKILFGFMLASLSLAVSAMAQDAKPVTKVLFTNANILDVLCANG